LLAGDMLTARQAQIRQDGACPFPVRQDVRAQVGGCPHRPEQVNSHDRATVQSEALRTRTFLSWHEVEYGHGLVHDFGDAVPEGQLSYTTFAADEAVGCAFFTFFTIGLTDSAFATPAAVNARAGSACRW